MSLPICEICHEQKASILICLEHDGQTEKHHLCMECVGDIADSELAGLLNQSNLDFSNLKTILHQMQTWQEPQDDEMDSEEIADLEKLQAMMGDNAEADLDKLANDTTEKVLIEGGLTIDSADEAHCPQCGTSWKDIHEDGLVGCPHCYTTFAEPLQKVMEQLHHSTTHIGKIPRFREKQERQKVHREEREKHRVQMLESRLAAAIQSEDFEEAAQIRDKIGQVIKNENNKTQNTKNK